MRHIPILDTTNVHGQLEFTHINEAADVDTWKQGCTICLDHIKINIFMEGDLMFTPLTKLVAQEEFEKHHSFRIYWEEYCSCYEITHVYYWDEIYDKDFDYKQTTFTDPEFDDYLNWLDQHNEIVSEETLSNEHCFVSLQTCKDLSSSVRIIITAKEITREAY
jgi:hypothetical protein